MLESYTSENFRDFGPRYLDTYGFLATPGQPRRLVYICDLSDREVFFRIADGGLQYHALRDTGVQFEFIQVNRGFFMGASRKTYLLSRNPARQWKRGIGQNNTSIMELKANDGLVRAKLCIDVLTDIYVNPIKVTPALYGKSEVIPLSKHFAITPKYLFFYQQIIGTVDNIEGVINLYPYVSVQQELNDVLNRNDFSIFYKVATDND